MLLLPQLSLPLSAAAEEVEAGRGGATAVAARPAGGAAQQRRSSNSPRRAVRPRDESSGRQRIDGQKGMKLLSGIHGRQLSEVEEDRRLWRAPGGHVAIGIL